MTTTEAAAAKARVPAEPGRGAGAWWRGPWLLRGVVASLGVVLFLAYLVMARKLPVFGDGSAQALQAWDMLHGNVTLRGWTLSDVSFYTTELPQYMVVEVVRGLGADVVHVAAAMTYAVLVVVTAVLARGGVGGREGLVRVLIPVGIMLAPPFGQLGIARASSTAWVLLSAPDHTGTQVPLVLAWLMLDRLRPRWWVPAAVAVVLAWVQVADPTALYEGVVPVVLVCGVRMYRRRGPLAGQWYDLALAAGAVASAGVAQATLGVIRSLGGFAVNPAVPFLATPIGMNDTLWLKLQSVLSLFGADFFSTRATNAVVPLAHLVAVGLVGWAVAVGVRRFAGEDLGVQVLTVSFAVLLAAFVLGYRTGAREAVGLLPIGAALAGRLLAGRVLRAGLAPVLAVVLACYGLLLVHDLYRPAFPNPDRRMAAWLQTRQLTYGLSVSWLASSGITVYSHDHVQVRDVQVGPGGWPAAIAWNTRASWYDPRLHDARFLIWDPAASSSPAALFRAEGRPAATYTVDGYTIYVWHRNLLRRPSPQRLG